MPRFTPQHLMIFAGCLVSIGAMGAALPTWHAAVTPAFVFGVLGAIGSQIAAILTPNPDNGQRNRRASDPPESSDL